MLNLLISFDGIELLEEEETIVPDYASDTSDEVNVVCPLGLPV
jgi:hypothetical protein